MGISSLVGAGISAAGSLFGASESSSAAKQAMAYQEQAGQNAQNALTGALQTSTSDLTPYTAPGSNAAGLLNDNLSTLASGSASPTQRYVDPSQYATGASDYLTDGTANNISGTANNISASPYDTTTNLSQSQLEQTPGYQFTEDQGLKSVQNSAAARGLGVSGAALKGAATYATGLANNTYQTQYQDELTSNAQNFANANTAANTDFGQQSTAATDNFTQQSTANEQNFNNELNANKQNATNALGAAAQNYGMDQTSDYTDPQAAKAQGYSVMSGAEGLGLSATGQQVGANTSTAQSTANALTGVGSAQAAATNASGQAWGSALSGLGSTAANGISSYNAGQALTGGTTLGNALTGATGGSSGFLGSMSNALLNPVKGAINGGTMNV